MLLDPGGDVAFPIDHCQIGRVTRRRLAGLHVAVGFVGIDEAGALCGIGLGEQFLDRNGHKACVGNITIQIGIGQFHGLNLAMQIFG